ncbi:hypothetical protein [Alteriqipengyuania sp.]|uniref:hypothetical protein n=1 Tax=Alteriqipengyuania sp. TaxID=2800692 RepID=UPI003517F085
MRTILATCACIALAACGGAAGDGEDQLDTADLEANADAPDPGMPEGSGADPAGAAEDTMQEMAQPVACTSPEKTLFFCEAGRKQIAVCGIYDAEGERSAQYRYGSDTAEPVLGDGRFASVPYSGGGEAQIEFLNGSTRYIVYSRTVRTNFKAGEPNNPELTDGVMVVRGGEVLSDKQCTGDPQSVDVMAGDDYGGVESELFYPED